MTKLILRGKAGQGIKLLSRILVEILKDKKYNIALTTNYSPFVRAGDSNAFIIFSKDKIENPLIDKPDKEYNLSNKSLEISLLARYNNKKVLNMILLGKILKEFNIKLSNKDIKKYLRDKFSEENLKAINSNYN